MNATWAFTGLTLASATLIGLVWLRTRSQQPDAGDPIRMPASTDYEQLFSMGDHITATSEAGAWAQFTVALSAAAC